MKQQIPRLIFLTELSVLKNILSLLEFKHGKTSDEYLYLKKKIMDEFYNSLKKLFKTLETEKLIQKCENNCSLRKGYSDCKCGGSGYINVENK